MYTKVNKSDFMDRFRMSDGRYDQMGVYMGGYKGLSALFDYLESYESDTGENVELDVIALCCKYTYYDSFDDVKAEYDQIKDIEDLNDHTQVIEVEGGGIIIKDF